MGEPVTSSGCLEGRCRRKKRNFLGLPVFPLLSFLCIFKVHLSSHTCSSPAAVRPLNNSQSFIRSPEDTITFSHVYALATVLGARLINPEDGSSTILRNINLCFHYVLCLWGDLSGTVVKVLCYKSEGRWFDRSWCHKILPIAIWPWRRRGL